jgi:uncharacterized protein YcbK (DUF882 family)
MIDRRQFLSFATAAAATLIASPAIARPTIRKPERAISFYNIHTGEAVNGVYWAEGRYDRSMLTSINRVLRDHRNDAIHNIDIQVIELLTRLRSRIGITRPFHVISGYRSPESNAMLASMSDGVASHSLHMEGKAVDVRVEHMSPVSLGRVAKGMKSGGVGIYRRSNFVHVDCGKVRTW